MDFTSSSDQRSKGLSNGQDFYHHLINLQKLIPLDYYMKLNSDYKWYFPITFGIVLPVHYDDVIMNTMASQITSLSIVCSTVCSGANQRKHQTPRHWPLWWEFTGDRWIPRRKGLLRGKYFHLMTSSWAICWLYWTRIIVARWSLCVIIVLKFVW